MQRVTRQRLESWAVACLEKVGVPPPEARLVASSLVQTSVWGIDSHGVLRLTHYLNRMTIGSISPSAAPVVMRTGPVSDSESIQTWWAPTVRVPPNGPITVVAES